MINLVRFNSMIVVFNLKPLETRYVRWANAEDPCSGHNRAVTLRLPGWASELDHIDVRLYKASELFVYDEEG